MRHQCITHQGRHDVIHVPHVRGRSITAASPVRRFAFAHSQNFSIPIRRGWSTHSCRHFVRPPAHIPCECRRPRTSLSHLHLFKFHATLLVYMFGTWIFGLEWQLPIRALVFFAIQISFRGYPNNAAGSVFYKSSHSGSRTPKRSRPVSVPAAVSLQGYAHSTSQTSTF